MYLNAISAIRYVLFSLMGICLLLSLGCTKPSQVDLERLSLIDDVYGNKFSFEFIGEYYIEARLKEDIQANDAELISIFKLFAFDESGENQRKTRYMYLNYYDKRGKFQYQLYYNRSRKRFEKGSQDYH